MQLEIKLGSIPTQSSDYATLNKTHLNSTLSSDYATINELISTPTQPSDYTTSLKHD